MTDDELIERMVREAATLGPMTDLEFQAETRAIRAYAAQAWQAGLASGPAGGLDLDSLKHDGRLAGDQKEGDLNPIGGPAGGPAEEGG